MMKIFGHKNPDTDSIMSALAMEVLQNALGYQSKAYRLGELNKETAYALNYFGYEVPDLLSEVTEDDEVILVDHNEFGQSVDGIEKATPYLVVDHHRVSGFTSASPLFFRVEPTGCTATIIFKMFEENKVPINNKVAGLLASAIISDSLLFKSPTCTDLDKEVCVKLAEIAGLDLETYGLDMLKAGTDLSDFTVEQMLQIDAKSFTLNGLSAKIAQINTVDIESVLKRQGELEQKMNELIDSENLDLMVFVVTDIMNSNSEILSLGNRNDLVEKAFDVKLVNNRSFLKGVVSRKKQIVPPLEKLL